MAPRPIFTLTHPRACSTAFERVFMTRRDMMDSAHEPFGDAYYYGPEAMAERFKDDPESRQESPFCNLTYKDVLESFDAVEKEGKRVFIKDMAYYLFESNGQETSIAESLGGGQEPGNPTVLPLDVLKRFHFTFLIRHPRRSIPSLYRCMIPPLQDITGWDKFLASEAGYEELVRMLDFLLAQGLVDKERLTIIDADELLDNPDKVIRHYCDRVGIDFDPKMLVWNDGDQAHAEKLFAKWNGFHDDVLGTSQLHARSHAQKTTTTESENKEWREKYGEEAQKLIRANVDANTPHYEYLKQFQTKI